MTTGAKGGHWTKGAKGSIAKAPYLTFAAAMVECERIARVDADPGVRPYLCRLCAKWHVGHPTRRSDWWSDEGRAIDSQFHELGARAIWAMKKENVSSKKKRTNYVAGLGRVAAIARRYNIGGRPNRSYQAALEEPWGRIFWWQSMSTRTTQDAPEGARI